MEKEFQSPPSNLTQYSGPHSMCRCNKIADLREQIKSNAGLLFPHASSANAQLAYDIVIMSHTADAPKLQYQAGLTFTGTAMQNLRKGSLAARGQPSDSVVGALHNLLLVTATALEKYQGNVLQDARAPEEIVGGVIDQALVLGSKKLKLFSGRD